MSWTHYSKAITVGVLLAVALGAAGTALAADITVTNEPEVGEAGDEVSMEVVIDDPHPPSQWTLTGETELEDASWSIEVRDIDGSLIDEESIDGDSFSQEIDSEDRTDEITISVSGDIPEIETFDYENIDEEEYAVMHLQQDGSTIDNGEIRSHRWQGSEHQEARQTLDSASAAVEDADDDDAREDLENAIAFYNQGDFDRAISLAESAESQAEQAGQTRQLLMIGGAVVALIVVAGGGYYYYRSRQEDTRKLQ